MQHGPRQCDLSRQRFDPIGNIAVGHAERVVFRRVTTRANAQRKTTGRDRVEGCRNLCHERWMSLRHIEDEGANLQRWMLCQGGCRQRGCLEHRALWCATPHEVIPDP